MSSFLKFKLRQKIARKCELKAEKFR